MLKWKLKKIIIYGTTMKKYILFFTLSTLYLFAKYNSTIQPIASDIQKRMLDGNSWSNTCPTKLKDLRYLTIVYYDFKGKEKLGEMIVHRSIADEVTEIFEELYNIGYPIQKMKLVSDYNGNDYLSIENDNTSAFNCRKVTGGTKWSKHSYGLAIDINPIENPYVKRGKHSSHNKSRKFEKRVHKDLSDTSDISLLKRNDRATQLFINRGWVWGGDWKYIKDYQHFQRKPKKNNH